MRWSPHRRLKQLASECAEEFDLSRRIYVSFATIIERYGTGLTRSTNGTWAFT